MLGCVFVAAFASASIASAEPISVLYWDGTTLDAMGPGLGATIPAGAVYAIDELNGVGLILAAVPGTASPDPSTVPGFNVSNPSIATPNGVTFEIPDAGNVSSITQNNGSVTVTYKDGATATVPGQYVPPGSPPPAPPPAQQPSGPGLTVPDPDPQLEDLIAIGILDDAWVGDFLGAPVLPADVPPTATNSLYDTTFTLGSSFFQGSTDTIVQRSPVPDPASGAELLVSALLALGAARRKFG